MHVQNNATKDAQTDRERTTQSVSPAEQTSMPDVRKQGFIRHWLKRLRKRIPPIAVLLFMLILAFGAGFIIFSEHVGDLRPPPAEVEADAIIVLTGGKGRIETAMELLAEKRGQRVLISGVYPSTNGGVLQRITNTDPALFACCVDLDRTALNTIGNAVESAKWIEDHQYKRVFVVTNNYHLPRSLLELSRRVVDAELIAYPVINEEQKGANWVQESDALRVLLTEYVKYLGALLHLNSDFLGEN